MGTSLNGLTPATTFDGLLKTSDNDAITSSLKTIGSGDGTDSCLQLSDSALKVNSGQVTIVGAGNTGATSSLLIQNSSASNLLRVNDSGEIRMQTLDFLGSKITSLARISTSGLAINNAGTSPDANTQVHIKGSGATSATTALLVQNSAGNNSLVVTDNGRVGVGGITSPSQPLHIDGNIRVGDANDIIYSNRFGGLSVGDLSISTSGNTLLSQTGNVGIGETTPTARLQVKGSGNDNTTTSLLVQNSDGVTMFSVKDSGFVDINPTNSSGGSFKVRGDGADNLLFVNANDNYVGIGGTQSSSSVRAYIKGKGASAGTTALLVQNSAGTEHLKITDDGTINARSNITLNHATNSSRSLRLSWGSLYATDNAAELNIGAVYSQPTSPRIILGGKTRSGGADAVLVQALNGMYLSTTAYTENPSAQLHVKAGTTQASIAKFEDPRATTDYIEIKNDSTLTDYTGLYWGTRAKIRSKQAGAMFLDCTSGILFADGNTAKNKIDGDGNMSIGTPTIPASTRLTIKGQGATSATTALLVQNSSGTELFKVNDAGVAYIKSAIFNTSAQFRGYVDANTNDNIEFIVPSSGNSFVLSKSYSPTNNASALLDIQSTTQGFLPPRMTGTQRDAIEEPASGLIIYNTTTNKAQCYNGTSWNDMF
jgi:hypothetical protein